MRGTLLLPVSPSPRHMVQQPMAKPDLVYKSLRLKVAGCSSSARDCWTGASLCCVYGLFLVPLWQDLQARGSTRVFGGFVYMSRGLCIHSQGLCVHAWRLCVHVLGLCVYMPGDGYTWLEVVRTDLAGSLWGGKVTCFIPAV